MVQPHQVTIWLLTWAVVHPKMMYLQKTSLFFNYHSKTYKNLLKQLFPKKVMQTSPEPNTIVDTTTIAHQTEENILQMSWEIIDQNLLPANVEYNRGLINVLTGQKATPKQASNKLTFCEIGVKAFQQYISHHILMQRSSASVPMRRCKLLTMETVKLTRQNFSQKGRESNK